MNAIVGIHVVGIEHEAGAEETGGGVRDVDAGEEEGVDRGVGFAGFPKLFDVFENFVVAGWFAHVWRDVR